MDPVNPSKLRPRWFGAGTWYLMCPKGLIHSKPFSSREAAESARMEMWREFNSKDQQTRRQE